MSGLNVLVVGASVAGPTAAYWLARAGARVTVIERAAGLRSGGQNVDIRTVGVTAMRKMPGLEAAVRAQRAPVDGLSFVRSDGRPYGVIRATGDPDQQSIVSEYEIFRGDLSQILYDLTKDHDRITYVFGEEVSALRQKHESITAEFAHGFPTAAYDLVVACDGATSRTRAMGLDGGVRDHLHPVNVWAAYFPLQQDLLNGSTIGLAHCAAPGRFVGLKRDPSGVNRATLMAIHPKDDAGAMRPFRAAHARGERALKEYIAQQFADVGWKTPELLAEMKGSDTFYATEMVQVKPPALYKGRFVMVGDAGYGPGPTGAGTSLAMAGGYVLAGEISKHKGNVAAALKGYEQQMRPLIDDLQKIPPVYLESWHHRAPGASRCEIAYFPWLRGAEFWSIHKSFSRTRSPAQRDTHCQTMTGWHEDGADCVETSYLALRGLNSPTPNARRISRHQLIELASVFGIAKSAELRVASHPTT